MCRDAFRCKEPSATSLYTWYFLHISCLSRPSLTQSRLTQPPHIVRQSAVRATTRVVSCVAPISGHWVRVLVSSWLRRWWCWWCGSYLSMRFLIASHPFPPSTCSAAWNGASTQHPVRSEFNPEANSYTSADSSSNSDSTRRRSLLPCRSGPNGPTRRTECGRWSVSRPRVSPCTPSTCMPHRQRSQACNLPGGLFPRPLPCTSALNQSLKHIGHDGLLALRRLDERPDHAGDMGEPNPKARIVHQTKGLARPRRPPTPTTGSVEKACAGSANYRQQPSVESPFPAQSSDRP